MADQEFSTAKPDLEDLESKWARATASGPASLAFHEDTDNGTNKITVTAPTAIASDKTLTLPDETGTVATRAYADALVAGLSWKQAVRAATAAAGTLASDFENGDTIDGVVLATGDRILIKNQAAATENGIYVVAASGAPARATDSDTGAELVNASVYVQEGTANADKQFVCTTNAPITIGATNVTFTEFSSGGGAVSPTTLTSNLATEVPLTIVAHAGQSVSLQEWKNSGGTNKASIKSNGTFRGDESTGDVFVEAQYFAAVYQLTARPNNNDFGFLEAGVGFFFMTDTSGKNNRTKSDYQFAWSSSSTNAATAADTGLKRNAAGIIAATNGSTGIRGFIGGGASVASATALPLPTGRVFHVTGTTNITSITATNLEAGVIITLIFDDVLTFTDGNNLVLAGNFVTSANDTITLAYDGTNFYETNRSVN